MNFFFYLVFILQHEMIHAFLRTVGVRHEENDGHGVFFVKIMEKINAMIGSNIRTKHRFFDECNATLTHIWRCNNDECRKKKPFYGLLRLHPDSLGPGPSSTRWKRHQDSKCKGTFEKVPLDHEEYGMSFDLVTSNVLFIIRFSFQKNLLSCRIGRNVERYRQLSQNASGIIVTAHQCPKVTSRRPLVSFSIRSLHWSNSYSNSFLISAKKTLTKPTKHAVAAPAPNLTAIRKHFDSITLLFRFSFEWFSNSSGNIHTQKEEEATATEEE